MRIRVFGQVNILGGGVHFREFTDATRRFVSDVVPLESIDRLDPLAMRRASESSTPQDVNIWFWPKEESIPFNGFNVVWAIFESSRLPPSYLRLLAQHDSVWVPSDWGRDVLIRNGVDAGVIDVVPEGVNPAKFHPHFRKPPDADDEVFRFLAVGKFESRKGYEELFDAFARAFDGNERVRLVIKGDYFIDHGRKRKELESAVRERNMPNVDLLFGSWSDIALLGLYSSVDSFVFPSRAEGWGLPLIEALAVGLPCISTNYSGHSHYLHAIPGLYREISHTMVRIDDADYLTYWPELLGAEDAVWAKANVENLATGLLDMVERRKDWSEKALAASGVVRQRFAWDVAVDAAFSSLHARDVLRVRIGVGL